MSVVRTGVSVLQDELFCVHVVETAPVVVVVPVVTADIPLQRPSYCVGDVSPFGQTSVFITIFTPPPMPLYHHAL